MTRPGTRRALLLATAAGATTLAAGCLDDGDGDDPSDNDSGTDPAIRLDDDRALTSVFPIELYDVETDELAAQIHWHGVDQEAHWHNQPVGVPVDGSRTLRIDIEDTDGEIIGLGADEAGDTVWEISDAAPAEFLELTVEGDRVELAASEDGSALVYFDFYYDDEHVWETPRFEVVAGDPAERLDPDDDADGSHDHGDGDHDHGAGDHDHGDGHDHDHENGSGGGHDHGDGDHDHGDGGHDHDDHEH